MKPKKRSLMVPRNSGKVLHWNGFAFHVRGFRRVQNQALSTYGKSPQCTKRTIQSKTDKKTSHYSKESAD